MSAAIYLFDADGILRQLPPVDGGAAEGMPALLLRHPELLSGVLPSGEPRRLLLVRAGDGSGGGDWPTGHLFLDQDGVPTIVETRSPADTVERRALLGEALDLLAQAPHRWTPGMLRARLEDDPRAEERLTAFLDAGITPESFWARVAGHLAAGRLRLLVAAAAVPVELERALVLLGREDAPEVAAIEIRRYAGSGLEAYLPTVLGERRSAAPPERPIATTPVAGRWDEAAFLADARARLGADGAATLQKVLGWARERAIPIEWGARRGLGSFSLLHASPEAAIGPIWFSSQGRIELRLGRLPAMPAYQREHLRREIIERLTAVPGFEPPPRAVSGTVGLRAALLHDPVALGVFLDAASTLFARLRAAVMASGGGRATRGHGWTGRE